MAIDFPNSPSVNDTFTVGNIKWIWTGTVWKLYQSGTIGLQGIQGTIGLQGIQGGTLSGVDGGGPTDTYINISPSSVDGGTP